MYTSMNRVDFVLSLQVFRHTNLKQTLARKFEKWMEGIAVSLRPAGYWTGDEYFYSKLKKQKHRLLEGADAPALIPAY